LGPIIAWYDRHPIQARPMWLVGKAGEYSYSIYLLHFFFVAQAARFIDEHVMRMPDLVHALPWTVLFFLAMVAVGHASWRFIEEPPLRWRKPYFVDESKRPKKQGQFTPEVDTSNGVLAR